MLPGGGTCDIPTTACCNSIYDVANWLLNHVYERIVQCVEVDDCTRGLKHYVTLGAGDDGVRNALTVAFGSMKPSLKSVERVTGRQVGFTLYRGTFRVMLRESGWPMVTRTADNIAPPDPDRQHLLALHAYSHAEKMLLVLDDMRLSRQMNPTADLRPSVASFGPLTSMPPLGGTIGFYIDVELDFVFRGPM